MNEQVVITQYDTQVLVLANGDVQVDEAPPTLVEIGTLGLQGDRGPEGAVSTVPGPQGPQGPPGHGTTTYIHYQNASESIWLIEHNIGKYPSVLVKDSAGTTIAGGDINYLDENTLTISFVAAFTGIAYLN